MKINIGTNKGNLVGVEVDKDFNYITMADIIPLVTQKFGELPPLIYGWAPYMEKAIVKPEDYKEKSYYKELNEDMQRIFDAYFSRAVAAGMEFEVLDYLERQIKFGQNIITALQEALYEWDC